MANISKYLDKETANTNDSACFQRAENLAALGVSSVLELCVGPSLSDLEKAYNSVGISRVFGNDIDKRWATLYKRGNWIIGDAIKIAKDNARNFDALVVAPPLSRACSGTREDALSLEEVTPAYTNFLNLECKVTTFVLPGKTLSIKQDREMLFKFLAKFDNIKEVHVVPLKKKVTKYVDVYVVNY